MNNSTDSCDVIDTSESLYNEQILQEELEIQRILGNVSGPTNKDKDAPCDIINRCTDKESGNIDDPVVGIDLGTTYSSVSIWRNNKVEVLSDEYGTHNFPSVVSFGHNRMYIGNEARNQIELNPDNTFHNVKRIIGRKFDDKEVQMEIPYLSYKITDNDGRLKIEGRYKRMYPEEVSAIILRKLKEVAEFRLGCKVKRAVITVPSQFSDAQKTATLHAAQIAEIDCIRIINEPTAAALAYGITKRDRKEMVVLVYDLGGGTLDATLMHINTKDNIFQVLATVGNGRMGGEDFDNRLVDHCCTQFRTQKGYDNLDDLSIISKHTLKRRCERAKRHLSTNEKAIITVQNFHDGMDLKITITRRQFEHICKDLFIICLKPIDDIIRATKFDRSLISEIMLVGGGTRMPKIVDNLRDYFGKEPNNTIDPDLVVSMGASIMGYMLSHVDDPFASSVVLLDITPLSLGIETSGGTMSKIINRGTFVPFKCQKRYTTDTDDMSTITISIFEGERKLVKDNRLLGSFEISDIDPAPRGIPQIIVDFAVDANGILDVTARDIRDEGTQRTVRITGNHARLSPEEIERLVIEARDCMLVDELHREISHLKYEINEMCTTILENINNAKCSLKQADCATVKIDTARVIGRLEELNAERSIDVNEFREISGKLKKKYATLILRSNKDTDNVNSRDNCKVGTSVYNTAEEEEDDYHNTVGDELEEDRVIEEKLSADERIKIIKLRQDLIDLYTNLRSALNHANSTLSHDHKQTLMDLIDDKELWVHTVEHSTSADYEISIRELNSLTNEIMENYKQGYKFKEYNMGTLEQLECTCYALRGSLQTNGIINKAGMIVLSEAINDTLDWIFEIKDSGIYDESECLKYLNNLNKLSAMIYDSTTIIDRAGIIGPILDDIDEDGIVISSSTEVAEIRDL
jgi:molecular chaperone DnaK (HSP70)